MSTITITQTLELDDFKTLLYDSWHYSHYWLDLNCAPASTWFNDMYPNKAENTCIEDKLWAYLENGHRIECHDHYSDERFTLTWAMIKKGTRIFVQDFSNHYQDFVSDNSDACTADVWLQCVCLDDVVYG